MPIAIIPLEYFFDFSFACSRCILLNSLDASVVHVFPTTSSASIKLAYWLGCTPATLTSA